MRDRAAASSTQKSRSDTPSRLLAGIPENAQGIRRVPPVEGIGSGGQGAAAEGRNIQHSFRASADAAHVPRNISAYAIR